MNPIEGIVLCLAGFTLMNPTIMFINSSYYWGGDVYINLQITGVN